MKILIIIEIIFFKEDDANEILKYLPNSDIKEEKK